MDDYYEFLDNECDSYQPLSSVLKNHNISEDKVKSEIVIFKDKFRFLTEKYNIDLTNPVKLYLDVIEKINDNSDDEELQYIYVCLVTDYGLLNEINSEHTDDEQLIRNYIKQKDSIRKISGLLKKHKEYSNKIYCLKNKISNGYISKVPHSSQELENIISISDEFDYLKTSRKNEVFRDNINALLMHIGTDEILISLKPYILFAMLTRKNGMMQQRENYIPNISSAINYQKYNIISDNGKNFDLYQEYIELYISLRDTYKDDNMVNTEFCDYCFAYLSPLSEWFYTNCEYNDVSVPMMISRYIYMAKPRSFPMLFSYRDYDDIDFSEFESRNQSLCKLWNKVMNEELVKEFLEILYQKKDTTRICDILPKFEEHPECAELLFYSYAEMAVEQMMMDASLKFIKI